MVPHKANISRIDNQFMFTGIVCRCGGRFKSEMGADSTKEKPRGFQVFTSSQGVCVSCGEKFMIPNLQIR